MRSFRRIAALSALLLIAAAPCPVDTQKPVRADGGAVAGSTDPNGVTAYLGIPFGAPPVGNLRWRPPYPAARWDGVRDATHFGASCMQTQPGSRLPWTEEFMTQGPISEDCLYLNVWTAAKPGEKQAVMFFIYGGGFTEGSGSVAVYDGAALARKGVIVVNANYRVGPLGFLVHRELTKESEHHSSGNYGLLDQIAALRWIQRNIAAFGGDPANVTIFGQSAGGMSVADLMRSPIAQGLFARAIVESGAGLFPDSLINGGLTFAQREEQGVKYAESKGAHSLAELRDIPAADFFKNSPGAPGGSGPVTDGWVLTANHPAKEVPVIVGMVSGDAAFVGGFGPPQAPTVANFTATARKTFGDKADAYLKLYNPQSDAGAAAIKSASQTDQARVSIDVWSDEQLKRSGKVYTYYFDRGIPWPAHPEFGAFHSAELPYIFETLHKMDRPWTSVDEKLSEEMSSYWSNFAKSGDPNGAGLAPWRVYAPGNHVTMELGEHSGSIPVAEPAKVEFFVSYLKK